MPELPDLSVVSDALHASLAGRRIESAEAPGPLAVRGTPAELAAMIGQRVQSIRRRGKFLLITLDRDAVMCNPMLTGRFQLAESGTKLPAQTAFILRFGTRAQAPADMATWTRGAPWVSADDLMPEIRYRDQTQMGKIYLRPAGVDRAVPGLGDLDQGPDADDPDLTVEVWASGSVVIRANSRTSCATRPLWRGSGTPTATRSCMRPGCCRFGSGRASPRKRSTCSIRRRRPRWPAP